MSLPALPTPPLSEIPVSLDELDDTIPTTIIGESSAAVTPGTPAEDAEVFRIPFKPTRSFVSTPFPEKRSFIDDEDEDEDDEEGDDEKEGRADISRDTL